MNQCSVICHRIHTKSVIIMGVIFKSVVHESKNFFKNITFIHMSGRAIASR